MNEYELHELGYCVVSRTGADNKKRFSWWRTNDPSTETHCLSMQQAIRSAFADAVDNQGGVFVCQSCGQLQTGKMMRKATFCASCDGPCKAVRLEDEPDEPRFVIYAPSESGYWSNTDGWGSLAAADTFPAAEIGHGTNPPLSAKRDAAWVMVTPELMESIHLHRQICAMRSAISELEAAWNDRKHWKKRVRLASRILEGAMDTTTAELDV